MAPPPVYPSGGLKWRTIRPTLLITSGRKLLRQIDTSHKEVLA